MHEIGGELLISDSCDPKVINHLSFQAVPYNYFIDTHDVGDH
jgi:hypothetical protein